MTSFRKEEKGNKIETNLFLKELDKNIQTLKIKPTNLNVKLTSAVIEPEISLAKANKYGIEAGDADFEKKIEETADQSGMDKEQIRSYYSEKNIKKTGTSMTRKTAENIRK